MWHAGLLKRKTQNQLKHKLLNTASLVNYISSLGSNHFFHHVDSSSLSQFFKTHPEVVEAVVSWSNQKKNIISQHPTVECSVSVVAPQISWKQLQMEICSCFMVLLLIPGSCLKDTFGGFLISNPTISASLLHSGWSNSLLGVGDGHPHLRSQIYIASWLDQGKSSNLQHHHSELVSRTEKTKEMRKNHRLLTFGITTPF